ncbi:MAG: DUF4160 domain-containing protein [Saprospiraceae bacterium]
MPTFFTIDGIRICLYFNDHNPPHFHALFAEYELIIGIKTLEIIEGDLPKKQLKKVEKFAKENQDLLMEIWNQLSEN